jgi:cell division protein YceG involved in septum cleavage
VYTLKKLWKNYSYAIILVLLTMFATIIIKFNLPDPHSYMTITIQDGESLWEISQKYENQHGLSDRQFIEWVEKKNGISRDYIVAGKDLMVPITEEAIIIEHTTSLASE